MRNTLGEESKLPKWADDISWWVANTAVAILLGLTLFAAFTLLDLSIDRPLAAVCIALGWLIGRSGVRR